MYTVSLTRVTGEAPPNASTTETRYQGDDRDAAEQAFHMAKHTTRARWVELLRADGATVTSLMRWSLKDGRVYESHVRRPMV